MGVIYHFTVADEVLGALKSEQVLLVAVFLSEISSSLNSTYLTERAIILRVYIKMNP